MNNTALVVGANGLIGNFLVFKLLEDNYYEKVIVLVRRSLNLKHAKLEERIVDFDQLKSTDVVADDIFCCLGTTIRKAGSQDAFYKVDFTYPLEVAKLGLQNGAKQFLMVTALGSDSQSKIFYSRVKGQVEAAIKGLGYQTLHIFQPSILLGTRKEARLGEGIGKGIVTVIGPLMLGPLKKYKGIQGGKVAVAMLTLAKQNLTGTYIHLSDALQAYEASQHKRPFLPRI